MSALRLDFVALVKSGLSVSEAARRFHISRKTAHKWLKRHATDPDGLLCDAPRKPKSFPKLTDPSATQAILALRHSTGWGPRKIRQLLLRQPGCLALPSERTFANILARHRPLPIPPSDPLQDAPQRFQRELPNQTWQLDFKGPLEIARQRVVPFAVLDDHSRYLLALRACSDMTMLTAWNILWELFGACGLPRSILCDNAFAARNLDGLRTVSWFDSRLIRLGIKPLHGRPFHPQTQGKIERLNGTIQRELLPRARMDSLSHFDADCNFWRTTLYNTVRPHDALGGLSPAQLWQPSTTRRPHALPEIHYPDGSLVRKVNSSGEVYWNGYRILAGLGIAREPVRIEEREFDIVVFYDWFLLRTISKSQLVRDKML